MQQKSTAGFQPQVFGFAFHIQHLNILSTRTPQFYLFNKVALEGDVSAGLVRKSHGGDVSQSLCLMDDGVGEGQVLPVLDLNLTTSYHPAQLLLDLV